MSEETKHSPLPWRINPIATVYDLGGAAICDCGLLKELSRQDIENAGFIVRACNSHEALVSACELALKEIGDWPEPYGAQDQSWIRMDLLTVSRITAAIQSALSTAKGAQ